MSIESLVAFLQEKGNHHFSEPEEIANYLKKLARSSYQLSKSMKDPVNLSMSVTLSLIRHIESQLKRLDKEISRLMQGNPQRLVLTSVKGIGDVFTADLLAEIGDIKRFNSHHALVKYASLVWSQYQSGEYESEDTKRMRTGNKYLRYYLIQAADSIRKHDADYQAFYQKKYNEVTRHQLNTNARSS
ncbi:transposase [Sporolactobacillus shoreicorticis]|uniref:Transposase n=1 Tax=Sporolactobacillus shoreicorticis TaxID=1923877 RepID=A0ABW5S4F1_9BACL|nr:transposase [Sporolactobacillus shoreicorticis]MCO7127350.1 transposase [Sporolactobacillus shoreicorticis]